MKVVIVGDTPAKISTIDVVKSENPGKVYSTIVTCRFRD
jgi:hypothetical protein